MNIHVYFLPVKWKGTKIPLLNSSKHPRQRIKQNESISHSIRDGVQTLLSYSERRNTSEGSIIFTIRMK